MLAPAYLGLIVFIIFFEIYRKKSTVIDFLSLFNLGFIFIYPLSAFLLEYDFGESRSKLMFNSELYKTSIEAAIAIFAGYFIVVLGFYSTSSQKLANKITIRSCTDKTLIIYAISLLIFSGISIQIYSSQYGGIDEALSNTMLIRSNVLESGSLVFFKHFVLFCNFSSYLIAALLFKSTSIKSRTFLWIILVISVIVSMLSFTLTAGRSNIIKYFITFLLAYITQHQKITFQTFNKSIPLLFAFVFFIIYGRTFFAVTGKITQGFDAVVDSFNYSVYEESDRFDFYEFIGNFIYPFHSLNAALTKEYQWRLFIDIFYGIIAFLPEKLLNVTNLPKSISSDNTAYIVGTVDYGIPPGLLAFGIYSMSWFGLIILCFFYGWIARYLQTILSNHLQKISWIGFIYVITIQVWLDFTFAGDFEVLLIGNLWFFLASFPLIFILCKVYVHQQNRHSNI